LNAIPEMIHQYEESTMEAFRIAVAPLWSQGFAFGTFNCFIVETERPWCIGYS
jgi:hypothetical protein